MNAIGHMSSNISTPRPMMVEWHITRRCNLKCPFCYIEYEHDYNELDDAECFSVLDQIQELKIPGIIFSGGEPLLREDLLCSLIKKASSSGIRCVLATNGTLLSEATLHKLKSAGVSVIGMSLDGSTVETHERMRGLSGSYQKVLSNLELCKKENVPTHIQTCSTQSNYREIPSIIAIAQRYGVYKYLVLDFVPSGRGEMFLKEVLSTKQRENLLEYIYWSSKILEGKMIVEYVEPYWIRKVTEHEAEVGKTLRNRFYQGGLCMGGNSFLAIMPDGSVYPCPRFPVSCGNIKNENLGEIWATSDTFKIMRLWANLKEECISCGSRNLCDGCRARTRVERGDYFLPDFNCYALAKTSSPVSAS
jgi:AdoMet-dependent heme synthase